MSKEQIQKKLHRALSHSALCDQGALRLLADISIKPNIFQFRS